MAAPYDGPIPGTPQIGQADLGATTAYNNALAKINQQRSQTLRQYGYLGDIDPTSGTISNMRVDPMNQYGGLQSMLRSQAQNEEQAQFANEERGLHGGGLGNQALSNLKYDEGAQSAQLGQALTGSISDLQDQQTTAATTRDQALYKAELDAARQAIQNQQFNPADYSGDPTYGDTGTGTTSMLNPPELRTNADDNGDVAVGGLGGLRTSTAVVKAAAKKAAVHNKLKKKGGR